MNEEIRPLALSSSSMPPFSEIPLRSFEAFQIPHAASGVMQAPDSALRSQDNTPGYAAAQFALTRLFEADGLQADLLSEVYWRRDALGKPYIEWDGKMADWAQARGRDSRHLHVSNTHDGGAHLVLAAYGEALVGIGIDAVWLPRLRRAGKDESYLLRFARQFMSQEEWESFEATIHDPFPGSFDRGSFGQPIISSSPSNDGIESLRLRVAAHFSLMEAASKACGTGLKIGVGMGKATSLPKQSLGVRKLVPPVELLFTAEAQDRLQELGAVAYDAYIQADAEFLVSAVALYRSPR